jgi:hypothetical protein
MAKEIPQGSTPERHAQETAQIAEVFGLTGGELESEPWRSTAIKETSGTLYEVNSFWWYEGAPEWSELAKDTSFEYRTQVRDILFGEPETVLQPGDWQLVATYLNSGETECHHADAGIADADCPLCEGDGFIYIGDGWAEVVYRRPVALEEDL